MCLLHCAAPFSYAHGPDFDHALVQAAAEARADTAEARAVDAEQAKVRAVLDRVHVTRACTHTAAPCIVVWLWLCVTVQATADAALAAALAEVIAPPIVRCVCAGMCAPLPRLFLRLAFVCVCPKGGGPAEGTGSHTDGPRPFTTAGSAPASVVCLWHWGLLRTSAHSVLCVSCCACLQPSPAPVPTPATVWLCGRHVGLARGAPSCVCVRAPCSEGPVGSLRLHITCLVVRKGVPYGCLVLRCGCFVVPLF